MNIQSLVPFLLILLKSLGIAFLLEALVIYFLKIKRFWPAVGVSVVVNLLALVVLYGAILLMEKLGYEFNGLQLPLQVLLALWWVSVIVDGLLLSAFSPKLPKKTIFLSSIVMNAISYLFLSFFIINNH
jgi:hypothetical protein